MVGDAPLILNMPLLLASPGAGAFLAAAARPRATADASTETTPPTEANSTVPPEFAGERPHRAEDALPTLRYLRESYGQEAHDDAFQIRGGVLDSQGHLPLDIVSPLGV